MNYGGGGYGGPPGGYGGPPGGGYGPPPGGMGGPPPPGWGPPPPPMPMGPTLGPDPNGGGANGLAIASLICGILALPGACCCYSSIPLGIAATVMGLMVTNKLKLLPDGGGNNKTMAWIGVGCGIAGIVIGVLMACFGAGMQLIEQLQNR